jgi:subtilisin family serine protease
MARSTLKDRGKVEMTKLNVSRTSSTTYRRGKKQSASGLIAIVIAGLQLLTFVVLDGSKATAAPSIAADRTTAAKIAAAAHPQEGTPRPSASFGVSPRRTRPGQQPAALSGTTPYIVSVVDDLAIDNVLTDVGITADNVWRGGLHGFSATLDDNEIAKVRSRPDVVTVEADNTIAKTSTQTNPPSWGLDRIDQRTLPLDNSYSSSQSGAGVTAYVLDSGLWMTHTEFTGRILRSGYWDFGDGTHASDCDGHGTHTTGILAGTTYGVAKQVSIIPVKVLDCTGAGTVGTIVAGVNWIINDHVSGPAVVNMSVGGAASVTVDNAVQALINDGVTVVVAAGNATDNSCSYSPGRVAGVITVAASEINDTAANYSNYGVCNDIFAPGTSILSAWAGSNTASHVDTGTSMASPFVAGAAALVLAANPSFTPAQVWASIDASSTKGTISTCCVDPNKLLYIPQPLPPPATASIAVAITGTGTGTVTSAPAGISCNGTCAATFPINSIITLTETRAAGSMFTGWSGTVCTGLTTTCTIPMNSAQSATATFALIPPPPPVATARLEVNVSNNGGGTVTSSPAGINACTSICSVNFPIGTVVTLSATPTKGWAFDLWMNIAACVPTVSLPMCTFTLNTAMSTAATWDLGTSFIAIQPARLLDTRVSGGPRSRGSVTEVHVQQAGVPLDAGSVALNVTATDPTDAGYITVYACGVDRPTASNLNYSPGETIPNAVFVYVGSLGNVCIYTSGSTNVIVDVNGWFPYGSGYGGPVPHRLMDTRTDPGAGIRPGGTVTELRLDNREFFAASAAAAALNVTVTEATGAGYVTVYPCDHDRPTASNLNFVPGQTVANAVIAQIGAARTVCLYVSAGTHLIVDQIGWFLPRPSFGPLVPARLLDTRSSGGPRGVGSVTEVQVTGRGGVPADAASVALNVTVTEPAGAGYVTVYPCGTTPPTASNLNFTPGETIPNAVLAKVGAGGKVCLYTSVPTQLVVDVNAWFPAGP